MTGSAQTRWDSSAVSLVWTAREQVIVHPRTIAIPSTSTGLVRDLEGQATTDLSPADIAFHAIREYMPGDDPRTIHWKSTAKSGALMVRQFEDTRRSHLVVALGIARGEFADDEEFEPRGERRRVPRCAGDPRRP